MTNIVSYMVSSVQPNSSLLFKRIERTAIHCKARSILLRSIKVLMFLFLGSGFAQAQERIELSLNSRVDLSCSGAPSSYSPKSLTLSAGRWTVLAKSGAWQPRGDGRYVHSFNVRVSENLNLRSRSGEHGSPQGAVAASSSLSGSLTFSLSQAQSVEVYIPDSYCPDNAGSEVLEFVKRPAFKDRCNGRGNPCQVSTRIKFASEIDIYNGIGFARSYNSVDFTDTGLGAGWRSSVSKRLDVGPNTLTVLKSDGTSEMWFKSQNLWQADSDSKFIISANGSEFTLVTPNGSVEIYSQEGLLLSEIDTNGNQKTFSYNSADQLIQVENTYGHTLVFDYDSEGRVNYLRDDLDNVYRYEYDAANNLVAVVYPDSTPNDDTDNPRKIYHYEKTNYPNHLTGITDENGVRHSTYTYDSDGKAISTEHAQTTNAVSQEKFELNFQ